MNPIPLVLLMTYRLGQRIFGADKLDWTEVDEWIKHHGNRNNYGRSYAGSRLPPQSASKGFVELRKERISDASIRLIASVYFDFRSTQPVTSKTWIVKKFDKKLDDLFGKNLRVRIRI